MHVADAAVSLDVVPTQKLEQSKAFEFRQLVAFYCPNKEALVEVSVPPITMRVSVNNHGALLTLLPSNKCACIHSPPRPVYTWGGALIAGTRILVLVLPKMNVRRHEVEKRFEIDLI